MPFDDENEFAPEEPTPEPTPGPAVPSGELNLTARQFLRARGFKWQRSAGFLHDMKRAWGEGARKPCSHWQPLWDAFWQRAVK